MPNGGPLGSRRSDPLTPNTLLHLPIRWSEPVSRGMVGGAADLSQHVDQPNEGALMNHGGRCAVTGWYADPWRHADLRYWNGTWTGRTRTVRPCTVRYRQPNHGLHLALSVVTFGLWLPMWAWSAGGGYRITR